MHLCVCVCVSVREWQPSFKFLYSKNDSVTSSHIHFSLSAKCPFNLTEKIALEYADLNNSRDRLIYFVLFLLVQIYRLILVVVILVVHHGTTPATGIFAIDIHKFNHFDNGIGRHRRRQLTCRSNNCCCRPFLWCPQWWTNSIYFIVYEKLKSEFVARASQSGHPIEEQLKYSFVLQMEEDIRSWSLIVNSWVIRISLSLSNT